MRALLLAIVVTSAMAPAAQARRDPTQPPSSYAAPTAVVARDPLAGFRPEQIVTVGGERHVLWQLRRYRVGEQVQGARIEKIEESEVWLRTPEGLRKLPVYARVEKRPIP